MGARTRGLANNVLSSGKLDATDAVSGVIPASNIANASLTSATSYGSVTGGVPAVASDPPSPAEGDIWYNTSSGQIKFRATVQAWASGGSMNTGRVENYGNGVGTQTAAGVSGGSTTTQVALHEQYNGTSWTEVGDLNTARRKAGGFGTSTAAFAIGASPTPSALVESWNGTSWTETTDINTARGAVGAAGTITDGLIYGAETTPRQITEYWNGTSWTEVNDMGVNQGNAAGAGGTGSSAFMAGGTDGLVAVANTEEWTVPEVVINTLTTS